MKLYEEGVPNQGLIDLIAANVRLPEMTLGDMAASLELGARCSPEICDRYWAEAVEGAIELMLDNGERMTRLELARLVRGRGTGSTTTGSATGRSGSAATPKRRVYRASGSVS